MASEYVELEMSGPNGVVPFNANPVHVAAVYDNGSYQGANCNLTTDNGFTYVIVGSAAEVTAKLNGTYQPPHVAVVENISNQNPANVRVAVESFPFFTVGALVDFEGTGSATLDAPGVKFPVVSVNTTGKTFKVDADLSGLPASLAQGTASVPVTPVSMLATRAPAANAVAEGEEF